MKHLNERLNAYPIDWLLEEENPSVRYFALKDVLGKREKDPLVETARKAISSDGMVPKILARQERGGYWGRPEDFYMRSKYRGTVWQFIILAELGADSGDRRVRDTCEFILERSQDRQSGGFSYDGSSSGGGHHSAVIPCLTGNMVFCLIRFGYLDDPRARHGIDWITTYQRFDDGIVEKPVGWPYEKHENCWGKHTCHMGVVKALKALAEIPARRRTRNIKRTIEEGAEYLLDHHVYKSSTDPGRVAKRRWLEFGFPLMWNTDALEILGILTRLGYRDERMQDAIDLVISKQDVKGKWKLESTYNGRFLANIERKGRPSKWITLNALRALKGYYG